MSDQDISTLIKMLVPFFAFIIFIITYFLFKTRKQNLPTEHYIPEINSLKIELKEELEKKLNTNITLLRFLPLITTLLMFLFVFGMILLGLGPDGFNEITQPSSHLFKISIIVFALMMVGAFLGYLKTKYQIDTLEKAIKLARNKKIFFSIDQDKITVPVLIITNPAFWKATDQNLYEISIPLANIKSVEVFSKAGKAPSQFLIKLDGESQYLGEGAFEGLHFGFGIKRECLKKHEKKILSFFKDQLGEKLIIRDHLI